VPKVLQAAVEGAGTVQLLVQALLLLMGSNNKHTTVVSQDVVMYRPVQPELLNSLPINSD
jgi:hypothetical protein